MTEYNVNPSIWYQERLLKFKPTHFVVTKTAITEKSLQWIYETCEGRFCLTHQLDSMDDVFITIPTVPAFEDPKEAILYELTWS